MSKPDTVAKSYLSVVDRAGEVLMKDQHFADVKFEGVEFVGLTEHNPTLRMGIDEHGHIVHY